MPGGGGYCDRCPSRDLCAAGCQRRIRPAEVNRDTGSSFKVGVYRNPDLLRLARLAPHCMCGCGAPNRGDVVSAHSNQLRDGKGRGLKAHDYRIAFLAHRCHAELDQGRAMTREQRERLWEDAHRATIGWLFENGHLVVRS